MALGGCADLPPDCSPIIRSKSGFQHLLAPGRDEQNCSNRRGQIQFQQSPPHVEFGAVFHGGSRKIRGLRIRQTGRSLEQCNFFFVGGRLAGAGERAAVWPTRCRGGWSLSDFQHNAFSTGALFQRRYCLALRNQPHASGDAGVFVVAKRTCRCVSGSGDRLRCFRKIRRGSDNSLFDIYHSRLLQKQTPRSRSYAFVLCSGISSHKFAGFLESGCSRPKPSKGDRLAHWRATP